MDQEQVAQQPTQQPSPPPKPQPIVIRKNNNAPLVGAIIFLALVIAATAFYLGGQKELPITTTVPTPQPTTPPPTPTIISDPTAGWTKFTSTKMKDLAFAQFMISYPPAWIEKEEKNELTNTITFTKGEAEIKIYQAPMGGSACIFEGEMPEGPATDYRKAKYVDIKNKSEIILRRITPDTLNGKVTYSFCSNSLQSPTTFGIPTLFGGITYTLTNPSETDLKEMDTILSTLLLVPKPPK